MTPLDRRAHECERIYERYNDGVLSQFQGLKLCLELHKHRDSNQSIEPGEFSAVVPFQGILSSISRGQPASSSANYEGWPLQTVDARIDNGSGRVHSELILYVIRLDHLTGCS